MFVIRSSLADDRRTTFVKLKCQSIEKSLLPRQKPYLTVMDNHTAWIKGKMKKIL